MKLIQSFWSCNKENILDFNAGWYAPEYNVISWALSSLQLKKHYGEVTLYTDSNAARIFIDILKLPYTEVVCNLDNINSFHPQLWALPKIYTYSQQTEPFLHVDGDVYIWKPFSQSLLNQDLIAQNLEIATSYYESHMKRLETVLTYFPPEIIADREANAPMHAYNAGIFGGSDLKFFHDYTNNAFSFIEQNKAHFSKIDVSVFNVFFEQYLFKVMVKDQKKNVSLLLSDVIGDNEYTGFGQFSEVPYNKHYLHLLGTFKRDRSICEQMADRLRLDYPEYFYRIINLFKMRNIPLKRDFYHHMFCPTESNLTERHLRLKSGFQTNMLPAIDNVRISETSGIKRDNSLLEKIISVLKESDALTGDKLFEVKLKRDISQFDEKIKVLLESKFINYSVDYLYGRDLCFTDYFSLIFENPEIGFNIPLITDPLSEVIHCDYNWHEVYQYHIEESFYKVEINSEPATVYVAIIPECDEKGYTATSIDELDILILDVFKNKLTVNQAMEEIKNSFDPAEIVEASTEFNILILGRIKTGIQTKMIKVDTTALGVTSSKS